MSRDPTFLVVGADSIIGSAFVRYLQSSRGRVIGTTRRTSHIDESHVYLDLNEDISKWVCPRSCDVAVICANVTKLESCRLDPAGTAHINVMAVPDLVNKLIDQGVFVVYLSSAGVFDGSIPYEVPESPFSPLTEHGRQKAEAERRIDSSNELISILRIGKVLSSHNDLFLSWKTSLGKGHTINPFLDMPFSPVPLKAIVAILRIVCDARINGVLQLTATDQISYADAAYLAARVWGAKSSLVEPIKSATSMYYDEPVPSYSTLNIDRLRSVIGVEPPSLDWTLHVAFSDPKRLG